MEYIIIIVITILLIIGLKIILSYQIKKLKKLETNEKLDKLSQNYPNNIEMAKEYLKKLGNETVQIEENKQAENSLYIAISNKIMIANVRDSFTRIQTIAHECLHSVQNRKMLLFNFIFSNLYLLYFIIICIFAIFKMLPNKMMFLAILLLFQTVYCLIRNYLENDAMIKAKFLAKEYMEEKGISSKEEISELVEAFDQLNNVGIPCVNYKLWFNGMVQMIIFAIICCM